MKHRRKPPQRPPQQRFEIAVFSAFTRLLLCKLVIIASDRDEAERKCAALRERDHLPQELMRLVGC